MVKSLFQVNILWCKFPGSSRLQTSSLLVIVSAPSVSVQGDMLRPNVSEDVRQGEGEMADFKTFNKFETYFYMEIPHFEYGSFSEEEICLSRWYQIYFNIYPQMFLQEIAILFIYYLFRVL